MNAKEAIDYIENVTYKPGHRFVAEHTNNHFNDGGHLRITLDVKVPDSDGTVPTITRMQAVELEVLHLSEEKLVYAILGMCKDSETHEMYEWLKYKDKHIVEPHPDE